MSVRPGPGAPPCAPANVPALAQLAADAVQRAGSAMPVDQIEYILVYKANASGYPGADSNHDMPTSCAGFTNCVRFKWRDAENKFRYHSGTWNSSTINACFPRQPWIGWGLPGPRGTRTSRGSSATT